MVRLYAPIEVGSTVEVRPTSSGEHDDITGCVGRVLRMHGDDVLIDISGMDEYWVIRRRLRSTVFEVA